MSEERKQVLDMLAEGKITADEAERLLEKLEPSPQGRTVRTRTIRRVGGGEGEAGDAPAGDGSGAGPLRYLRVLVNGADGETVNIRVPLKLVRTGIKLTTVLPTETSAKLAEKGIDLSQLGELQGEELVEALRELHVDVEGADGETVRVFCE
ncbi:MAG: hypothetical protein JW819_01755 [Candidatus Krumholzibacteriota bacterium]|nr:hypothetical protein [Candidatus Krumholzibacteriota bacterium]